MSQTLHIVGGLMAAGNSKRFSKGNKLLQSLPNGNNLVQTSIQPLLKTCNEVYVVTGFEFEKIRTALKDFSIQFLYNQNYEKGLGTSLQCFLELHQQFLNSIFLIHFADMIKINSEDLEKLIQSYKEEPNKISVSHWEENHFGPPMIIPPHKVQSFCTNLTFEGGKHWLKTQELNKVFIANASFDIDSVEDFNNLTL